jgi:hypothetical protein
MRGVPVAGVHFQTRAVGFSLLVCYFVDTIFFCFMLWNPTPPSSSPLEEDRAGGNDFFRRFRHKRRGGGDTGGEGGGRVVVRRAKAHGHGAEGHY